MRTRAVLFDLDHTLFDTERAQKHALKRAVEAVGLELRRNDYDAYSALNLETWARYRRGEIDAKQLSRERFGLFLGHLGGDRRSAPRLGRIYLEALAQRGDLYPDARAVLRTLAARYRLAVVTNGYDRVQRTRLRASRLGRRFEVIVTSEASGFVKPDPRILHVALDELGVRPHHALYVGDDVAVDGGAAREAGVPFCWIDRGYGRPPGVPLPRRRVRSLAELPRLLA